MGKNVWSATWLRLAAEGLMERGREREAIQAIKDAMAQDPRNASQWRVTLSYFYDLADVAHDQNAWIALSQGYVLYRWRETDAGERLKRRGTTT